MTYRKNENILEFLQAEACEDKKYKEEKKMKKSTRRLLALLAAATLAFSLTACAGGNGGSGDTQAGDIPEGKLFAPGTEIDMVIASHASWPYNENWAIWEYFKEASGATFNIKAIPAADLITKLPLMIANGKELPDMLHTFMKAHVDPYATSGAFISYTDNMDKMPNMTAFLDSLGEEASAELLNQRKSGDGKVYSAPAYGTHRVTNLRTWLYRKDIFDKHGLEAPKTYDELYAVAKKLKELYPNSYPLCFREGLFKFEDMSCAWKNNLTYLHYYDFKNGEWKFGSQDPLMKEIVEYYRKLVDEGLVPPNFTTIETKSWEELMSTDRGFITLDYIVRIDFFNSSVRAENPEYNLTFFAPPVPNVEGASSKVAKSNLDFAGWVICNNGDKEGQNNAFKLVDWMYTDEAVQLLSWGKEGETYTINADGKKEFIVSGDEQVQTKYGVATYGLYQVIDQAAYESTYTEENVNASIEALNYIEPQSNPTQWLALNEDEEKRAAAIIDDLKPYCQEQLEKFLLNQQPMSEWDTFQAGLIEMGVEELLEIYSTAYNRVIK